MEIKFLSQPRDAKLGDILTQKMKEKFDDIYLIAGMTKDNAFETIYDDLKIAINSGTNVNLYVGIDRKNTSKDMLAKLLSIGANLNIHINTDDSKAESRIYIFDKKGGVSYIYLAGAKFSDDGLFKNICTFVEIAYSANESGAFEEAKKNILKETKNEFHKVDMDEVVLLAEKGEIVARITERKIPRIGEMYGNVETVVGEQVYDESRNVSLIQPEDLEDVDIDIDANVVVRENVELKTEQEGKKEKKEKEEILKRLSEKGTTIESFYGSNDISEGSKEKRAVIHAGGKPKYKDMTTLILESNKIIEKGVGAGEVKIPKELTENTIEFWGGKESFTSVENEKNKIENISMVSAEIIDSKDNSNVKDNDIKLLLTDKGIAINSEKLQEKNIQEGDLIRIIKEAEKSFRIEIIRKETEEYNIWICYCVNTLKGNKRRFGII